MLPPVTDKGRTYQTARRARQRAAGAVDRSRIKALLQTHVSNPIVLQHYEPLVAGVLAGHITHKTCTCHAAHGLLSMQQSSPEMLLHHNTCMVHQCTISVGSPEAENWTQPGKASWAAGASTGECRLLPQKGPNPPGRTRVPQAQHQSQGERCASPTRKTRVLVLAGVTERRAEAQ